MKDSGSLKGAEAVTWGAIDNAVEDELGTCVDMIHLFLITTVDAVGIDVQKDDRVAMKSGVKGD